MLRRRRVPLLLWLRPAACQFLISLAAHFGNIQTARRSLRPAMGREGSGGSGRLQHVWLEGSGVWAAVPESREESTKPAAAPASRSGQRHQDSRRGRQRPREEEGDATELSSRQPEPSRAVAAVAPPLAPSLLPTFTGFDLQEDKAASDVEECEPPETCPICALGGLHAAGWAAAAAPGSCAASWLQAPTAALVPLPQQA